MPIHRNSPVYLLSSANPPNTPAASHHAARGRPAASWVVVAPRATTLAIAQNVAVQKNSSGESGVMMTVPMPSNSVAFSSRTATMGALVPGNSRRAASKSIHDASAADSGPNRRTPSAVCPANAVPALIQSATIGG